MKYGNQLRLAISMLGLAMSAPAFADSIDGNWCHNDGRHFSIRGPEIVTPSGARMAGNYDRHGFSYVAPAPEKGAGQTIVMRLAGENTVYLRHGEVASAATPEIWQRCSPSISSLAGPRRS